MALVVIPHFNDALRLRRCLAALVSQIGSHQIVVVDNGSTQDLGFVSAEFPSVRLVFERERGAAAARNRGAREGVGALWFLDADCVPAPDWVAEAERVAGLAEMVGGAVEVFHEGAQRTGAQLFEQVFAFKNKEYVERKGFSVTANLLVERSLFERLGGFRGGVSEDFDLCQRGRALGGRLIYVPQLRVAHPSRATWAELVRKWRRLTEESFALAYRGPVLGRMVLLKQAVLMPLSVLVHLPQVAFAREFSLRERLACFAVLLRLRLLRMAWLLRQAWAGKAGLSG